MKKLHFLLSLVLCRPLYAGVGGTSELHRRNLELWDAERRNLATKSNEPEYAKCVGLDRADNKRCEKVYQCGGFPKAFPKPCHETGIASCHSSEHECEWFDPEGPKGPVEASEQMFPKYRPPAAGLCVDTYNVEPRNIRKVIDENDVPLGSGPIFQRAQAKCQQLCSKFRHECQGYTFPANPAAIPWCTLYGPAMTDEVKVDQIANAAVWKWQPGKGGVDVAQAYSLSPQGRDVKCYIKDRRLLNKQDEGVGTISGDHYVCVYNTVNIDTPKVITEDCKKDKSTCEEDMERSVKVCSQDCQVKWPTSTGCDNKANGHCRYFDNIDGVWCQCEKCDVSQEKLKLSCTGCTTVVFNNDNYDTDKAVYNKMRGSMMARENTCQDTDGESYFNAQAVASEEACKEWVKSKKGNNIDHIFTKGGAASLSISPCFLLIPLFVAWWAGV